MSNSLSQVIRALQEANRVVVCGHSMPDGDSIGSTLAVGLLLRTMNKQVALLSPDPAPQVYGFLPLFEEIRQVEEIPENIDTAVIVDCTDLNRMGPVLAERLAKIPVTINIDHHISNQLYAKYNYVIPDSAATGELIYHILNELEQPLTREIAECLYVALVMDTGSFRYENTTEKTHQISARLLSTGIDGADINTQLFENKDLTGLLLLGKALSRLQVTECGRVAWISIPYELTKELGAKDEHAEGIVNYPRQVKGSQVGLLFRETAPNKVKVGFRSKDKVDVNKVAGLFGGGGHPRAAGCVVDMSLQEAEAKVVKAVLSHIDG